MRLLKAIEKEKLNIVAVLEFDKQFNTRDFSFGILSLKRGVRSLYLDVTDRCENGSTIEIYFEYDESVLSSDVSKKADLKVEDLILGLDEAKLYIGEENYVEPRNIILYVEGKDKVELKINLDID